MSWAGKVVRIFYSYPLHRLRDDYCQSLWDHARRARMGIKVYYGDDSSQYEMVGGTRRRAACPSAVEGRTPW